jgi:hypothetical protein
MLDVSSARRFEEFWEDLRYHYKDDLVFIVEVGIAVGKQDLRPARQREMFGERVGKHFKMCGWRRHIERRSTK